LSIFCAIVVLRAELVRSFRRTRPFFIFCANFNLNGRRVR